LKHEVYSIGDSFGYRILSEDDVVLVNQEFDSELEGFNVMDEERAEQLAVAYIASYIPPIVETTLSQEERIAQLESENLDLIADNEYLKSRTTQLQDDNNFILEALATAGLLE
jgi:hypothetical protein